MKPVRATLMARLSGLAVSAGPTAWVALEMKRVLAATALAEDLPADSAPAALVGENKNGAALPAGAAVAAHPSGSGFARASATLAGYPAVGLMAALTPVGVAGDCQVAGPVVLADWSAVLDGGAVSLTPRAAYFLSPVTPGNLTAAVPTTAGQWLQAVGYAATATTLVLRIGDPLLL